MEEKEIEAIKKENEELKLKNNSLLKIIPQPSGVTDIKEIFCTVNGKKFTLSIPLSASFAEMNKAITRISGIISASEEQQEKVEDIQAEKANLKKELEEKTENAQKEDVLVKEEQKK